MSALRLDTYALGKRFGALQALDDVSIAVRPGSVHALLGENGAGKSTLMAVASGALAPDTGSVTIQGRPLGTADPRTAQALGLAIVRQTPALLPQLTVVENMELTRGRRWIGSTSARTSTIMTMPKAEASPTSLCVKPMRKMSRPGTSVARPGPPWVEM